MGPDLFAGLPVSDFEAARPWYRDADGNEVGFAGVPA